MPGVPEFIAAPLDCPIQRYAWGRPGALSDLLGIEADGRPEAELWMGAHRSAPSVLPDGRSLADVIAERSLAMIGSGVAEDFDGLPFLFKVLAARVPLSIQAHPDRVRARAGFARENAAGIDRDAPERVYRDPNHKPELIAALTVFEGKCGFRPLDATRRLFAVLDHPALDPIRDLLGVRASDDASILAETLAWLLHQPAPEAQVMARAVPVAAAALLASGRPEANEFRADLIACGTVADAFPGDVGGVVALLLNHVVLQPGEALFLDAGNLHAYLSGIGVELMANSDNVVRGGLTPKHIDVEELLAVVSCDPAPAPIQRPMGATHTYESPVAEFALTRLVDLEPAADPLEVAGPAIVLATSGHLTLRVAEREQRLDRGVPAFLAADTGPVTVTNVGLAWVARPGASLTGS